VCHLRHHLIRSSAKGGGGNPMFVIWVDAIVFNSIQHCLSSE
jgi:hypothetical protein